MVIGDIDATRYPIKSDLNPAGDPPVFRQLSRALQQKILLGALQPGARLPAKTVLARENGIHRSTVRDGGHVKALEENIPRTKAAMDDPDARVRLDIEFHELIATAANNRVTHSLPLPISDLFYPSFQTVMTIELTSLEFTGPADFPARTGKLGRVTFQSPCPVLS